MKIHLLTFVSFLVLGPCLFPDVGHTQIHLRKRFEFSSFDQAKAAPDFVMFEMESTKLGLLTTSFEGYAKTFVVEGKLSGDTFSDILLSVKSSGLDTDIDSRNEKMLNLCLQYKKYPSIQVRVPKFKWEDGKKAQIQGELKVLGKVHPVHISILVNKMGEGYRAQGEALLDFFSLGIPDPSIAVAAVEKDVKIRFSFFLTPDLKKDS